MLTHIHVFTHTPPYTSWSLAIGKAALEGVLIFRYRVDDPTAEDWSYRIASQFPPVRWNFKLQRVQ